MKKCVFAGSFDPPTIGHQEVVERALQIFDEVIVAIMVNPDKTPLFSAEEREKIWRLAANTDRVRIIVSDKTAAEVMKETAADCYLRGVRNGTDFDYETANYYVSEKLSGRFPTLYMPCPQELLHVSSSAVRTLLKFSQPIDGYVAAEAKDFILESYRRKRAEKNGK